MKGEKMTVRPLHDRILIKRIEEKETAKGASSSLIPPKKNRRNAK